MSMKWMASKNVKPRTSILRRRMKCRTVLPQQQTTTEDAASCTAFGESEGLNKGQPTRAQLPE